MTTGGLPARQHGHRRLTPPACMPCMQCMQCMEFCFTCIRCLHAKHIAPLKGGGFICFACRGYGDPTCIQCSPFVLPATPARQATGGINLPAESTP